MYSYYYIQLLWFTDADFDVFNTSTHLLYTKHLKENLIDYVRVSLSFSASLF